MRFLLYLALVGIAVYLLIALIQARGRRGRGGGGSGGVSRRPGPAPRGPVGPEDDPAFLAELDRRRREAERRAREKASGAGSPDGGAPTDGHGSEGKPPEHDTGPGVAGR